MKHQTLDQLHAVADIDPLVPLATRTEKIERWAELLDRNPLRCLAALTGTEYLYPGDARRSPGGRIPAHGCL